MSYSLGIDLGTTYTAAAAVRDGRAEMVSLGDRGAAIPSVVFLKEDETLLTGDAANRRAVTEPGRVAREFKRRIGDPTPIMVGGSPLSADSLTSKLLRWTVDAVAKQEGGAPASVVVCHPANWGQFKTDLLRQAIAQAGLEGATTITEPEAAAVYYASQERIEPGTTIAVYDLGGGTFDSVVLRKTAGGFEVLGKPEGVERLGGVDFDEAVFQHVRSSLGGSLEELDPADPVSVAAVQRLRADCVEAKETLSTDTDVAIPVLLPNVQTEVRLTRTEFEAMIRPALGDSISALKRAIASAGLEPSAIDVVLLVGGSSRIPLVAQTVSAELGRPVRVDAHPKHAIALGAALAASPAAAAVADEVMPEIAVASPADSELAAMFSDDAAPAVLPPESQTPRETAAEMAPPVGLESSGKAGKVVAAVVVILLLIGGGAGWWFFMGPGSKSTAAGTPLPSASGPVSPAPSHTKSPEPTATGSPGGGAGTGAGPAITASGTELLAGDQSVIPFGPDAPCEDLVAGSTNGSCLQSEMAGGTAYVLISREPTAGCCESTKVDVVTYDATAGGWVVWLQAEDPDGSKWASVDAVNWDMMKDGKFVMIVAFHGQGSGSILSYNMVVFPAGGHPTVGAHPDPSSHGAAHLEGHQIDEYRAEYPNGEPDCCPPYFLHRTIRYVNGAFRVTFTEQVDPSAVPASDL